MQPCCDELMQRVKDGDMLAFDILVRKWQRQLFDFVYRIVGDFEIARDVCQEVFLRVYQYSGRYQPRNQFKTWIYRIAINCSMNELRKWKLRWALPLKALYQLKGKERQIIEDTFTDPRPQPDEEIQMVEVSRYVQDALRRLPDKQRIVIILRHYEELKFHEIASILDCPLSTVKTQMRRGLNRLKKILGNSLSEGGVLNGL